MSSDPDRTFACTCCSSLGVRYDFIVLSAPRPRNDTFRDFIARLSQTTQTTSLAKLRHVHR